MNDIMQIISQINFETVTASSNLIISSILIILLGFYLGKLKIFDDKLSKGLTTVLLNISLPSLAFTAFMTDIDTNVLLQGINLLIWGFIMHILLIYLCKILYIKYNNDDSTALSICTIFGSITFFGIPIINAMYGNEGLIYLNIFNIPYRIFLYSYALIKMSSMKLELKNMKEIFLNPIIIATFAGSMIWIFQDYTPHVNIKSGDNIFNVSFLRIDKTLPWLFSAMKQLAGLTSPLAWLSVGITLSSISLKDSLLSKDTWYYSINKIITVPLVNLIILTILTYLGIMKFEYIPLVVVIVTLATPTASVATAYAIKYDKSAVMASNGSLLSTILSMIFIPVWVIIMEILRSIFLYD